MSSVDDTEFRNRTDGTQLRGDETSPRAQDDCWSPADGDRTRVQAHYPPPRERSIRKLLSEIDDYAARFIAMSPFCVLASASLDGVPEVSPRGGPPGFVRVLTPHALELPDRPGNNRLDTLTRVADNPGVALLFLVPGIDETLRVYGDGTIGYPSDPANGTRTVLSIAVRASMFHCAKAPMRARLWSEESRVDRSTFPTLGEILKAQTRDAGVAETQEEMLRRYEGLL